MIVKVANEIYLNTDYIVSVRKNYKAVKIHLTDEVLSLEFETNEKRDEFVEMLIDSPKSVDRQLYGIKNSIDGLKMFLVDNLRG